MILSLNYCEKNPVQGPRNNHCYHPIPRRKSLDQDGVRIALAVCCWCGQRVNEHSFIEHGPKKPDLLRRVRGEKVPGIQNDAADFVQTQRAALDAALVPDGRGPGERE